MQPSEQPDPPTFMMPVTKRSRYVHTEELIELNNMATARGNSRVFDPYEMLNLDPDGVHILSRITYVFMPFARCEVQIKVTNDPWPRRGVLDLEDDWYEALPTVEQYLKALKYYRDNPRRVP